MIEKTETYRCVNCGKIFDRNYDHGGALEHDGFTNDNNMNAMVRRFAAKSIGLILKKNLIK